MTLNHTFLTRVLNTLLNMQMAFVRENRPVPYGETYDLIKECREALAKPAPQPQAEALPPHDLCKFYGVSTYLALVIEQEQRILRLLEKKDLST